MACMVANTAQDPELNAQVVAAIMEDENVGDIQ
jgi:hypothetical protein